MARSVSNLRRIGIIAAAAILIVSAAGWWWQQRGAGDASGYRTTTVQTGDIRVAISATGTLSAISTVTVGSQVSGQVTEVLADFNDKRSEEHTSELQSLMRISYAVFCLKKKKQKQ